MGDIQHREVRKYWQAMSYCQVFPKFVESQKFPGVPVKMQISVPLPRDFDGESQE